jgi:hypothetical protein
VLNNNTLQNIQLINLANGNNNKLEYETDTDKPVNLSVPVPPERNLGDAGFLNQKAKKINLGTERCCCAAQTVSHSLQQRTAQEETDSSATGWEKLEKYYRVNRK